jgi:hypothetical protein
MMYSFDSQNLVWNLIQSFNGSPPSNRDQFGLTFIEHDNTSTLWVFGGAARNGKICLSINIFVSHNSSRVSSSIGLILRVGSGGRMPRRFASVQYQNKSVDSCHLCDWAVASWTFRAWIYKFIWNVVRFRRAAKPGR